MLFSSRIRARIPFSAWLASGYAHIFVLLSVVIVTLPTNLGFVTITVHKHYGLRPLILLNHQGHVDYIMHTISAIMLNLPTLKNVYKSVKVTIKACVLQKWN